MFLQEDWKPPEPVIGKKGNLDHQSCPFVFKREKRSMGSIKKICERSKWFHGLQSLLPAPKILAFNDWMSSRDRNEAVKPANQMGLIVTPTYWLGCSLLALKVLQVKISHQLQTHTDKSTITGSWITLLLVPALIVLLISCGVMTFGGKVMIVIQVCGLHFQELLMLDWITSHLCFYEHLHHAASVLIYSVHAHNGQAV